MFFKMLKIYSTVLALFLVVGTRAEILLCHEYTLPRHLVAKEFIQCLADPYESTDATQKENELPGLADYIKVCHRSDPNVDKCIINSIEELKPKLVEGIPELDVPPIEPLVMKEIILQRGPKGAMLDATMSNIKVWGPSNFKILSLRSDLKKNRFVFRLLLPHLHFEGNYKMDMQILLLSLHGKGEVRGNFSNYHCNVTMKGHKVERDGKQYLEYDKMKINLNVGDGQIYLSNLFNGDPVLGEATNRILNENSKVFLAEITPVLEKALSELFTDISNRITRTFTYEELFP